MTKTYSQEDLDKTLNNARITERFNAWTVMANLGIPAERIPPIYKEHKQSCKNTAKVLPCSNLIDRPKG